MKDYLKNPNFYYLLAPVVAAVWALSIYTVSLPAAEKAVQKYNKDLVETRKTAGEIFKVAPERLNYKDTKEKSRTFDYAAVINVFTKQHGIATGNYKVISRKPTKKAGEKIQGADLAIESIDIQTLAGFLSQILTNWPDLSCNSITLTKLKFAKNAWKASIKLTYKY